ncbi:NAD-dependent epimerase/dehydratase family protein [Aliikangiella coralliicola]|nr:NAD-dependent epimerase/dehydratase family protein [Aliikangiella coralliicola]
MKVFITGATGYVGRHIVKVFLESGYQVTALTRQLNRTQQAQISSPNLTWLEGSLESVKQWAPLLPPQNTIIHCAMSYTDGEKEVSELDENVVIELLKHNSHFIYTGNLFACPLPAQNTVKNQISEIAYPSDSNWRIRTENLVLNQSQPSSIIRPGFVYGGAGGYLWHMVPKQEDGNLHYVESATATWPMIHVEDLARLYLHIAKNKIEGIFHGADGVETKVSSILSQLSNLYSAPLVPVKFEEAKETLGKVASYMQTCYLTDTTKTRSSGWHPEKPDFTHHAEAAYLDFQKNLKNQ